MNNHRAPSRFAFEIQVYSVKLSISICSPLKIINLLDTGKPFDQYLTSLKKGLLTRIAPARILMDKSFSKRKHILTKILLLPSAKREVDLWLFMARY